jgi:hypothetical protein
MLIFLESFSTGLYAQRLIIRMNDGNENADQLNSVQKLYFSNNDLIVDFKSGNDDVFPLEDVRKIYFDGVVTIAEKNPESGRLVVFPNPACSEITVLGLPEGKAIIRIYRMDGGLVFNCEIESGRESIDISGLPDGLYLLSASGLTAKFIRK